MLQRTTIFGDKSESEATGYVSNNFQSQTRETVHVSAVSSVNATLFLVILKTGGNQ